MDASVNRLFLQIWAQYIFLSTPGYAKSYTVTFQSDINGPHLASTNVWIEYLENIPPAAEFTSCLWVKIKYFNFKYAACLWSYCMTKDNKSDMKCLRICFARFSPIPLETLKNWKRERKERGS